ncbi:CTP--molybdopterin cytidylyltransferase [Tabrizicola sp. TH137]|uniref:nucleotidyltransferase family protein n=1 Tax=Tabrizicola sp. TH137 TaxID=2067452 RepID=UPI000C7AA49C|nr:nucleotidyltransferase family protein [Tabrizicola sp. TH137]PLL13465.1 CTP--molybdopterin cytidylyltransferase [Tabrizicola sp. TH137]
MDAHILLLAAGAAARMRGRDKLLEQVAGEALLARIARAALATGLPVTVALPPDRPARRAALAGLDLRHVTVPDPGKGMAESLKTGLAALPPGAGVMLLLADLPDLTAADLITLRDQWRAEPEAILRGAAEDGTPGHPVCFPPDLRDDLMTLQGDEGARSVLIRHRARLRLVPLPGRHATTDLDTPEDWAAWRAAQTALRPQG